MKLSPRLVTSCQIEHWMILHDHSDVFSKLKNNLMSDPAEWVSLPFGITHMTGIHSVIAHHAGKIVMNKAAAEINKIALEKGGLNVLACNAGIMAFDDDRTVDGFNVEIQACHLSHCLLTKACMESLEQASKSRGESFINLLLPGLGIF